MIVCQCRRVTDRDVREAVRRGASDLAGIAQQSGAGTDCRGCIGNLNALLAELRPVPAARFRLEMAGVGAHDAARPAA